MNHPEQDIYNPAFVENLFSQMSGTYERMNTITSFGFSVRWRRQCAESLQLRVGMTVIDLMTGMGEVWPFVLPKIGQEGKLIALDFCPEMVRFAEKRSTFHQDRRIQLLQEDALHSSIPDRCADCVISTFGLKTFSAEQLAKLAAEIWRMLKPGGQFALMEVSKPQYFLLRSPYMFYLKNIIPKFGKICLGNPENYRMLGVYTERFENCQHAKTIFEQAGFKIRYQSYFGGCASGILGKKEE